MRLPINLDSLLIVDETSFAAAISPQSIGTKRGDSQALTFVFGRRYGAAEELENGGVLTSFKWGAKAVGDYDGDYVISNWNGATFAYAKAFPITVSDGVTVNASATLTSATAGFAASDVGKFVMGTGIPSGAKIFSVESASSVTLSVNATANGTGVGVTILKRTPQYTVTPPNSHELNKLLINGTVKADVADQTARYALTAWTAGQIAYQQSDGSSWVVIDATHLADSAGWGPAAQKDSVALIAELEWVVNGVVTSTVTFALAVSSDVNRGGEGKPHAANPEYPASTELIKVSQMLTGYTGGGSTNLDGVATVAIVPPFLLGIVHATEGLRIFQLLAGTTAEASPGIIRPDDYDGSTNAKIWKLIN